MIKNLKKELKVAGFKIQVKQTDQTCPKHPKVHLIITDKSDEPFCPQCQLEKMEQKKKEEEQAALAEKKRLESLVGLTIVEAGKCDFCPSETTDCK